MNTTITKRQRFSLILGLVVSLFFLWIGFRGLDFDELIHTLQQINLNWIGVAVPVYFAATYLITWRWWYLVRTIRPISVNRLFPVVLIGYMANNLLPLRLGEIMRAYVLRRRDNIPIPPTLTTILVERVFDGLTMLTFIFVALLFLDFEEPTLRTVIVFTTPLFFGALIVFFVLAAKPHYTRQLVTKIAQRFLPEIISQKVIHLSDEFLSGLEGLRTWQGLIGIIIGSLLSWGVESTTYWLVMKAFGFEVSFFVLLLVIGFGNLSTILPSTAGYIGTFHAVAILTLVAFGVDRTLAGSYAIVMHATLWLPITIVGFFTLVTLGFNWRDFSTAQVVVQEAEG
ncbi:MAG: TIGR00374 family protein [Phototrophicales bacterium]|nr:MAG: TIGR00374 family protein [Phototrophicales bacterium]